MAYLLRLSNTQEGHQLLRHFHMFVRLRICQAVMQPAVIAAFGCSLVGSIVCCHDTCNAFLAGLSHMLRSCCPLAICESSLVPTPLCPHTAHVHTACAHLDTASGFGTAQQEEMHAYQVEQRL